MGEEVLIPLFCSASSIKLLGIVGYTLDNIILLNGVISLRIGISLSLTLINGCSLIRLSAIFSLVRKMQKRLLDILDAEIIFFGEVIWLTAIIYSICLMPSIVLKTITWFNLGRFSVPLAVVSAKVFDG